MMARRRSCITTGRLHERNLFLTMLCERKRSIAILILEGVNMLSVLYLLFCILEAYPGRMNRTALVSNVQKPVPTVNE